MKDENNVLTMYTLTNFENYYTDDSSLIVVQEVGAELFVFWSNDGNDILDVDNYYFDAYKCTQYQVGDDVVIRKDCNGDYYWYVLHSDHKFEEYEPDPTVLELANNVAGNICEVYLYVYPDGSVYGYFLYDHSSDQYIDVISYNEATNTYTFTVISGGEEYINDYVVDENDNSKIYYVFADLAFTGVYVHSESTTYYYYFLEDGTYLLFDYLPDDYTKESPLDIWNYDYDEQNGIVTVDTGRYSIAQDGTMTLIP